MTDLPDLPAQVHKAIAPKAPKEKKRSEFSSPFRPGNGDEYKRPVIELIAVSLPAVVLGFAASSVAPDTLIGNVVAAVLLVCVLAVALREWRRRGARGWTYDPDVNVYRWHDDSGEWNYSEWQSYNGPRLLRLLVALAVPATFAIPFAVDDKNPALADALWYVILAFYPVLVYVYRHLPTQFRPATQSRYCDNCGKRRHADSVRICPKCGRVADVYDYPATPSLRRRFSSY